MSLHEYKTIEAVKTNAPKSCFSPSSDQTAFLCLMARYIPPENHSVTFMVFRKISIVSGVVAVERREGEFTYARFIYPEGPQPINEGVEHVDAADGFLWDKFVELHRRELLFGLEAKLRLTPG